MKNKAYKIDGKTVWNITFGGSYLDNERYYQEFDGATFIGTMEEFDFYCEAEQYGQGSCFCPTKKRHATEEEYKWLLAERSDY